MANGNEDYISLAIKRQAVLERVKSGQVRNFAKEIKKIERLIQSALLGLEDDIGELSRTKLNKLLSQLRADQAAVYKTATTAFLGDAATIAGVAAAQEVIDLKRTVDLRGTKLNAFTSKEVWSKVIQRPLTTDGQLLEPWVRDFSDREVKRVNNAIRNGWAQGKTNQELVRQIVGTKSKRYKDGILQTTRRNASSIVRTSVQHVSSAARQETWEANRDVIAKYQIIATLDKKTSPICRTLDGEVFEFGKGPIPPLHPNCRTTTIPVLDPKFDFLAKGRTRSAEGGPVSAKTTYYDWLKRENKATQVQILGPTRAKLFRDGGMTAERFSKLQFDRNFEPLTLDEMRAIEPEAFKRAGL
jgi:SPP1 gp7 family putative phage head morphogenesis protein